jgi:uncharacterized 2Fe-2S/4Fe-4S cluster protein (DUF4445 family)
MDHFGVERVDRIRLAGAFGAHIDVKYAMTLGMIPDCRLDQFYRQGTPPALVRASRCVIAQPAP